MENNCEEFGPRNGLQVIDSACKLILAIEKQGAALRWMIVEQP